MGEQPKAESGEPDITDRLQHLEANIGDEYGAEVCCRARKEIERLREALPSPKLLRGLAAWFDIRFPELRGPLICERLRESADAAEAALTTEATEATEEGASDV